MRDMKHAPVVFDEEATATTPKSLSMMIANRNRRRSPPRVLADLMRFHCGNSSHNWCDGSSHGDPQRVKNHGVFDGRSMHCSVVSVLHRDAEQDRDAANASADPRYPEADKTPTTCAHADDHIA
jgi:hypothetical protein